MEYIKKNLDFVFQNKTINSLMIMVTYSCQMDCEYCKVIQKDATIKEETLEKAIRLLFSSESDNLLLRFFGGEPLIFPSLIKKGILYAERLKKKFQNKTLRYQITTNGLYLPKDFLDFIKNYNTELMFSIDGGLDVQKAYRPSKNKTYDPDKIINNLKTALDLKIKSFVNMVVCPDNVGNLYSNFFYLYKLGVKRIQVGYSAGYEWEKSSILKIFEGLDKILRFLQESKEKPDLLMNLINNCEPVMLSDELIVDTDGKVYFDAAIFQEKSLPKLRHAYFIDKIDALDNIQDLFLTKKELYKKMISYYDKSSVERKIIDNNIKVGLVIKYFLENRFNINEKRTENKRISKFLYLPVEDQTFFREKLRIRPYILHITNNCVNNCLFCKNKDVPITPLEVIEYNLKGNVEKKIEKVCIVGNEPLNHPKILDILNLCKKYGFKKIEVMTSGSLLSDKDFVKTLLNKGVTSFSLPLYSSKEEEHDLIVQNKGDFEKTIQGIKNVNQSAEVFIHTNLLKQNISSIHELELFVKNLKSKFCILPLRPKTMNLPYSEIAPSYSDMIKHLKVNSLLGFPLCVIKKIQKNIFIDSEKISDSIKIYMLDQNYTKLGRCKECKYYNMCVGTFKEMIKNYGSKDLIPIK